MWEEAISATRAKGAANGASMLLLPALNEMIDTITTRTLATERHPPVVIFSMLAVLALASALLAGYSMAGSRSPSWLHMISVAAVTALAVYVIIDLEYPRLSGIRADAFGDTLIEVRAVSVKVVVASITSPRCRSRPCHEEVSLG
jgi:hypothetical protein